MSWPSPAYRAWRRRYVLDARAAGATLQQLGDELGISKQMVQQIERTARREQMELSEELQRRAYNSKQRVIQRQQYAARKRTNELLRIIDWFMWCGGSEAFDQFTRT